jgi:hypothetical protein
MQFADRDYLFHEYFCILPILGKHPFWVGLNPASKTESNLEVSLSSCAAAMYKGQPIPSHMRFVAARKEYPDVSVFWKDNPTIFSTTAAGDAGPMATLCLDAKGIFESLAPAFQNALQDYLVSVPGVLSQKDGVAYELPGGGYTDKFFDLRGLLINLPFKDALYEQAADLVERIANLVSANTVAAYGEVGAKLLGALERRKIDLKQVELGGLVQFDRLISSNLAIAH